MPNMELLTIGAFLLFFLLVFSFIIGIIYNVWAYGMNRSFETRTRNWQYIVLILVNVIIAWKLYALIL